MTITGDVAARAIARATGRDPVLIAVAEPGSDLVTILHPGAPPLDLVDQGPLGSPGTWRFDDRPTGPPGVVPRWTGWLVLDEPRGPTVVRLGDEAAMAASWLRLVERLTAAELSMLLARYFGHDAVPGCHHTVISTVEAFAADVLDLTALEPVSGPTLSIDAGDASSGHLTFWSSFLEPQPGTGEHRYGCCRWDVAWRRDGHLWWTTSVPLRGIRSRRFSSR